MKKIPVQILGATGLVGRKIVRLLQDHPFFSIEKLSASENSIGKLYEEVAPEFANTLVGKYTITSCEPSHCSVVFSALSASVAYSIELNHIKEGSWVISNARSHRMSEYGKIIIPEIHQAALHEMDSSRILTNPNCCVAGVALAIHPLIQHFDIEDMHVCTQQAISGAGQNGLSAIAIQDNVIPHILGEEEKIIRENKAIFSHIKPQDSWRIRAQATRVSVTDGHLIHLTLTFGKNITQEKILSSWENFSKSCKLGLPSSPKKIIQYLDGTYFPQPKLHRNLNPMGIVIGNLQVDSPKEIRFTLLVHNTVRGAAGSCIYNAESLVALGKLKEKTALL